MASSQNGWPVISRITARLTPKRLWSHPVAGTLAAGPVWVVLNWLIREYGRRVEPIDKTQSGGWNPRKITGSTKWSNHASATAVDLNWRKHPAGHGHTKGFTSAQIATIQTLMANAGAVLRWGGPAFNDPMHFEIAPGTTTAKVEQLAAALLQTKLDSLGYDLVIDGHRGPKTTAALTTYQQLRGLTADGNDGPKTWAALDKEN